MLPRIAIVGRPNVGKSSLLNMLAQRRVAIVDPTAGVTRDRIVVPVELPPAHKGAEPQYVEVVDTGGYGVEDVQDLTEDIERQIALALDEADLVLFVIDAQSGVVPLDQTVARMIRQANRETPVRLIANKVDGDKHAAGAYEAAELGFGEPLLVSAETKHNIHELYDLLNESIDFEAIATRKPADEGIRLAVVGKRNAGKSTLVNALSGEERVIVSEKEGTTRDSVDVRVEMEDPEHPDEPVVFTLIDTAGLRKRKSLQDDIEYYATHRALRSVRRADVCVLVMDATTKASQVDKQLVNEILRHERPVLIVVNKWDLVEEGDDAMQERFAAYLDDTFQQLRFAPIVFTAAIDGEGVRELLALAENLYQQARSRVGTGELNQAIETIMKERQPRTRGGKRAKVFYASQIAEDPPTLVLQVNDDDAFDNNYKVYMLNRLRDTMPFSEVPIKLVLRGKERRNKKK